MTFDRDEIIIYRKGKRKTRAEMLIGGRIIRGEASCNLKEDEYDFLIGAEIALKRLRNKIWDFNFRVKCLENRWEDFTEGNIYEVKDGYIKGDSSMNYIWYDAKCCGSFASSFERVEEE